MALKTTSGQWISAAGENRAQRDTLREAFFTQTGLPVAVSLREVFLSPADRIRRVLALMNKAATPRIDDDELPRITAHAMQELVAAGLAVPSLSSHTDSRAHGIVAFAPEVLISFFTTDHRTALERSLF